MGKRLRKLITAAPWGWIAVSCYGTALAFAFFAQWQGLDWTESYLERYQTLIAGLATFIALLVAVEQLRHQRHRDVVAAVLHYEHEFDALATMEEDLNRWEERGRNSAVVAALMKSRAPRAALDFDSRKWERLRASANVALEGHINQVTAAIEGYNSEVSNINAGFGEMAEVEANLLEGRTAWLTDNINWLRGAIIRRRTSVWHLIEASAPTKRSH